MSIKVDPGDENPAADALNGVYEKHYQLQPGDLVLDLGAHKGYFCMVAAEKVGPNGQIWAFEPHPRNYARLISRKKDIPILMTLNQGAWDKDEKLPLWEATDNSGGHSFTRADGQNPAPIECHLIDIGRFCKAFGVDPDFCKIDTECAEARILASLFRAAVFPRHIAAEVHNKELWDECIALLAGNGYEVTPLEFTNYYLYGTKK